MAFEPQCVMLSVARILPTRAIHPETRKSPAYLRLAASIRELGVIEPLIVHRQPAMPPAAPMHLLLDGHLRHDILKTMGVAEAFCLIARDDEAFTFNHKVNQVPPIQEHFMILKALENGVPEARIAATLNVDIAAIRQKRDLLQGICPEAVTLLRDRHAPAATLRELKRALPLRQIEMAELMVAAKNFSVTYAKCLIVATPAKDLAAGDTSRETAGVKPEDIARMEREMETLGRDFRLVEESHGRNTLGLVLAVAYLRKLLAQASIARYLSERHAEIAGEFQKLVEAPDLRNGA